MKTYRYIPKQTFERRRRRIRLVAAACFALLLAFLFWNETVRTSPLQALARATATLHQTTPLSPDDLKAVEGLVTIAERDTHLLPWALLLHAQSQELRGAPEEALETLKNIPADSAAALDGDLRSLRISSEQHLLKESESAVSEQIGAIRAKIQRLNRGDLNAELLFVEALLAEDAGHPERALTSLQTLRSKGKNPFILKKAQTLTQTILASVEASAAALTSEANVLVAEKRFDDAHDTIQRARALSPKDSREYFETLLLEEQILRKLKRGAEADEMLLSIAASNEIGIGDVALLRVAKNAWNINDQHRALEILDRLQSRFPATPLLMESKYIEARILEEINELADAKEIYAAIGRDASEPTDQIRAFKRLAWMYLIRNDFGHAAEQFEQVRLNAAAHIEALKKYFGSLSESDLFLPEVEVKARAFTETSEDLLLALFFQGDALNHLDAIDIKYLMLKEREAKALWETLVGRAPYSYYGFLAAERLGIPYPEPREGGGCSLPIPEDLTLKLQAFNHEESLADFAQADADYYFAMRKESLFPLSKDDLYLDSLRIFAARAKTSIEFVAPHRGIEIAETGLRRIARSSERNSLTEMCELELRALSFSRPFPKLFEAAAHEAKIPVELLYAIARTESFFNPKAESLVGAQGLVQVMPATAKFEGWDERSELTDPATNLSLGARHLRRLLDEYAGEKAYAIAAYNAGGAAVNRWKTRLDKAPVEQWIELIGYPETNKYVKRVLYSERLYREILVADASREASGR